MKKLGLFLMLAVLGACSFNGGNAYLPSRNGIVAGENVTVGANENIYTIAHEHNVSMRELIVLNNLRPPFDVKPGQSLTLPATGASFSGDLGAPAPAPREDVERSSLTPIEPAAVTAAPLLPPVSPSTPTAIPLSPPAAPASSAPAQLAPPVLTKPQSFNTPPPVSQTVATNEPVKSLNQPSPTPKPVSTTTSSLAAASVAATVAADVSSGDGATGDDTAPNMKWPVQGPILSTFGSKGAGLTNDGVNIGAPKGSPVVAAAPGTVVYAGNEMKGFGNLVLIRHHGDWVTAYAHLDRVLVKKDSVVAQGDEIGTVGKTGNVPSPQLHFEVRQAGKPLDPSTIVKDEG